MSVFINHHHGRTRAVVIDSLAFNGIRPGIKKRDNIAGRGGFRHQEFFSFNAHMEIVTTITQRAGKLDPCIMSLGHSGGIVNIEEPVEMLAIGQNAVPRINKLPFNVALHIAIKVIVCFTLFTGDFC